LLPGEFLGHACSRDAICSCDRNSSMNDNLGVILPVDNQGVNQRGWQVSEAHELSGFLRNSHRGWGGL
jgi:hypothetical protein